MSGDTGEVGELCDAGEQGEVGEVSWEILKLLLAFVAKAEVSS